MQRPAGSGFLYAFALAILLACACADRPCLQPPDCEDATCREDPACQPNEVPEDCDTPGDEDGDGSADEQDPECVDDTSPVSGVDCAGQETQTAAGGDADATVENDGCDDATHSDSGDGDTARVQIEEIADGVFEIEMETVETGGDDPDPTARTELAFEVDYEPGGDHVIFSAFDASAKPALLDAECESLGYTVDIEFRGWVPTAPPGGSFTCTVVAETTGLAEFRILVGVDEAHDTDGDGVSNRNDVFCPSSQGPVDSCGCAVCGTYLGDIAYGCDQAPPAGLCFFDFPAPGFCETCGVRVDGVEITAPDGGPIRVETDGDVVCNECEAKPRDRAWTARVAGEAELTREATGALRLDQAGASFSFFWGSRFFHEVRGTAGSFDQAIVDPSALEAEDVTIGEIQVETTDEDQDVVAGFEIESDTSFYEAEIETAGGVGTGSLRLAFGSAFEVTWETQQGLDVADVDCPRDGATVTFTADGTCRYTLERQEIGSLVPLTQTGIEVANHVATNFGDLGLGELFSVSGTNGVGVYRADNFSLVPSLSRIGGFQVTNVLGSLHLDAPGVPNDGHFYYRKPSGTGITQWFPELSGFGATGIGFSAVFDATYVGADPGSGHGVFAVGGAVQRLYFDDFGTEDLFLTSGSLVNGSPTGYSITSAFRASDTGPVLFATRNATSGENGRLFVAAPGSLGIDAAVAGDLGVDPRLLRCASAVADTWVCVTANWESGNATILTWDGDENAAVVGTIPTGPNPLVPGIAAVDGDVRVVIPSFTTDAATAVLLDGATGAVLESASYDLAPGCVASSALILGEGDTAIATCNGLDALDVKQFVQFPF
jgi:hypothetical protein